MKKVLSTLQKSVIGWMCKITNAYRLSCFLAQCIILVFRGVLAVGMQNSYMLQLRYEQHLVDEARSSDGCVPIFNQVFRSLKHTYGSLCEVQHALESLPLYNNSLGWCNSSHALLTETAFLDIHFNNSIHFCYNLFGHTFDTIMATLCQSHFIHLLTPIKSQFAYQALEHRKTWIIQLKRRQWFKPIRNGFELLMAR